MRSLQRCALGWRRLLAYLYSGLQHGVVRIRLVGADRALEVRKFLLDIGHKNEKVLRG
jgi:hypothetical protein